MAKVKKCRQCKQPFSPSMTTQVVCSPKCAIEYAKEGRKKEFRRETRNLKEKIKKRSDWAKEAQAAVNAYVRWRDRDEPCISCDRHHEGQYHAGHYRSVGSSPELRYEPLNIWKQCSACNNYLSGNLVNYRINLIKKIGIEKVEWLESNHPAKHYSIDDLKEIRDKFRLMLREAKRSPD